MGDSVVAVSSLEDWFRQSIGGALEKRHVAAEAHTEHYMVRLATDFARSENLYEYTHNGGYGLRPLARMLTDAFEASSLELRQQILQRLGDVALFIAGFFADSLSHKSVDVDYYSRMGEAAYGSLAEMPARTLRENALNAVFIELARKFSEFVDVLNEVAQQAKVSGEQDIFRLYELWVRTGSRRAADKLRELGVQPSESVRVRYMH
ncbi:MAG: hypothetical protein KGL13_01375 [Gammaproteobacteria bacterium]|nr:hypothetical protein [Gammaproteobacteria bacterium]MDE2345095.1 hypothetical protein [Gammaproteobacteria bacterium]